MSKFEVGARVAQVEDRWNEDEDDTLRGEVVGHNAKNGKLLVQVELWGGRTEVKEWDPEETLLETEADAKLAQLEKDFKEVENQVKDKVAAAAALLIEADNIADGKGLNLSEMHNAVSPLMRALRVGGWRTSALHC